MIVNAKRIGVVNLFRDHPLAPTVAAAAFAAMLHASPVAAEATLSGATTASLPAEAATSTIVDGITNTSGRSDRLAVTVARIAGPKTAPEPRNDMDIWVGEVELKGRKTVWVELIDRYGEVIYDSEIKKNETHLLPDGRAIVVRSLPDGTAVAKANDTRVATDANLVVTRRVVDHESQPTSIEFFTEQPRGDVKQQQDDETALVAVAKFGEMVWERIASFFSETASNVRYAFRWVYDAIAA